MLRIGLLRRIRPTKAGQVITQYMKIRGKGLELRVIHTSVRRSLMNQHKCRTCPELLIVNPGSSNLDKSALWLCE